MRRAKERAEAYLNGNEVNVKVSCEIAKDLIRFLDDSIWEDKHKREIEQAVLSLERGCDCDPFVKGNLCNKCCAILNLKLLVSV